MNMLDFRCRARNIRHCRQTEVCIYPLHCSLTQPEPWKKGQHAQRYHGGGTVDAQQQRCQALQETPAEIWQIHVWKLSLRGKQAKKCEFNLQISDLSTGLVAGLLSSQVKPWQKGVHARVFCDTQDMSKKGIFSIFSSAFRFALSHADGSQLDLAALKNGSCKNRFRLKE